MGLDPSPPPLGAAGIHFEDPHSLTNKVLQADNIVCVCVCMCVCVYVCVRVFD